MDGDFLSNILCQEQQGPMQIPKQQEPMQVAAQQEPMQVPRTSVRATHKRPKNFSNDEDKLLASAWLNTSMDPIQGNEHPSATYWERIHSYFHEHKKFESDRNPNSLMHRWGNIQKSVNKFVSCMDDVERRRPSGMTERDKIIEACAIYEGTEPDKKKFGFLHCWPLLQHAPKWNDWLSSRKSMPPKKKQKVLPDAREVSTAPISVDDDDEGNPTESTLQRPCGRKAAKKARSNLDGTTGLNDAIETMWSRKTELDAIKEQKKDERYERAYQQEQERIEIERIKADAKCQEAAAKCQEAAAKCEEVNLQRMVEEERIMAVDPTCLTGSRKTYYETLQDEILSRRLKDSK